MIQTTIPPSSLSTRRAVVGRRFTSPNFGAALIVIAGFIVLYRVLLGNQVDTLARFAVSGAIALVPSLAILQAIDGVALKEVVDAWAHAPSSETAIAFQNAELVRWMEWGANSFFRLLQGVTVLLFGLALARSGIVPRLLGWFGIGAGLAYIAVGAIVGYDGFSDPSLNIGVTTADALVFVAAAGIASAGWRGSRGSRR